MVEGGPGGGKKMFPQQKYDSLSTCITHELNVPSIYCIYLYFLAAFEFIYLFIEFACIKQI